VRPNEVGYINHGQPINIQLMGRAWDDDKLVGMAYAFEQIADAARHGHVEATTAPLLPHDEHDRGGATPRGTPRGSIPSLSLRHRRGISSTRRVELMALRR
jgi:hypothetical protein